MSDFGATRSWSCVTFHGHSATNWYQSFTHGLLARPEAAQRLTWWNAYGSTSGNPSLVLAVFHFYECLISNVFPLCMFFEIFAYK
jgi:hypothetical protein